MPSHLRPTWAEIDYQAIRNNVAALRQITGSTEVCGVVKGNGYGHGAALVAKAAIGGGATWLAVATVDEGLELREAGVEVPILLLTEVSSEVEARALIGGELTATVYSREGIDLLDSQLRHTGYTEPVQAHLKVDTGLHRLGANPSLARNLAAHVRDLHTVHLEGIYTHFAAASAFDAEFTHEQRRRFAQITSDLAAEGLCPQMRHACNSAGTTLALDANDAMVRTGAVLYGLPPTARAQLPAPARPALALKSHVSFVRQVTAGESIGYGGQSHLEREGAIAVVPAGYADGVPRRLGMSGGEVLIGGERRRIIGPAAMDQMIVACGDGSDVNRGNEVVLLGSQGNETITAMEWARLLDLSPWEVLTGIGPRVPRVAVNAPVIAPAFSA